MWFLYNITLNIGEYTARAVFMYMFVTFCNIKSLKEHVSIVSIMNYRFMVQHPDI